MTDMETNVRLLREAVDRDLGHRCPDFDPTCLTCRTHAALDGLVASIHELEQMVTALEMERNDLAMGLRKLNADRDEAMRAAYLAGFMSSGEGGNGEYPYRDKGRNPLDDDWWRAEMEADLAKLNENRPAISDRAAG